MQKFCLDIQSSPYETSESLKKVKMHICSAHVAHCLALPVVHIYICVCICVYHLTNKLANDDMHK